MSDTLHLSVGYTLVDITKTNEVSGMVNSKERNQQRNWETLVQVLGLRAQLFMLTDPVKLTGDLSKFKFGSDFSGNHSVWEFKFGVEQEAVFANSTSTHGTLDSDFVNVPIILQLTETALIQVPVFSVTSNQRNIYFAPFKI